AQHADRTPGLRFDGLFCFPGHITAPADAQAQPLAEVDAKLTAALDLLRAHSLEAGIVSGGSTPTASQSHLVSAYTEIRPGTYIYNDRNCVVGAWCGGVEDCAATLLCTVVSTAVPGKAVIDAGSKS